ncbi:MAG TPA: hypothetical protein VNJ08_12285 [Bacteriovoracaceae bacterium]|nr:hypothetical protein [Bacteriovoracaceae bacterium]
MLKILIMLGFIQLHIAYAKDFAGRGPICDDQRNENFDDLSELTRFMKFGKDLSLPDHKQSFCAGNPRMISGRILDSSSRYFNETLGFANPPGPVGGGMCWLHTRLQRQFTYLANYRPDLPFPSKKDALAIIDRIVHRKGVTEIPGYKNLSEFSRAYRYDLISAIDGMGWRCVANPNDCLARLNDSYSPTPSEFQSNMDLLYQTQFAMPGDIQMVRTRVQEDKGTINAPLSAHSLLILEMQPIRYNTGPDEVVGYVAGYRMKVIDPNYPGTVETVDYNFGNTHITAGGLRVIPYQHYDNASDIPQMNSFIDSYCQKNK